MREIEEYIARKIKQSPEDVIFIGISDAMPGYSYSEYTSDDFSAILDYKLDGEKCRLVIGEREVCDFLTEIFPVSSSTPLPPAGDTWTCDCTPRHLEQRPLLKNSDYCPECGKNRDNRRREDDPHS